MSESFRGYPPRSVARNTLLLLGRLLGWTTTVIGAAVLFWLGAALLSTSSAASAATPAPAQVTLAAPPSASAAKPPKPVKPATPDKRRGTPAKGNAGKTAASQAAPGTCSTCGRPKNSRVNGKDLPDGGKYPYVPHKNHSHTKVWWLLKLASPLCGPAVLVCAVAL